MRILLLVNIPQFDENDDANPQYLSDLATSSLGDDEEHSTFTSDSVVASYAKAVSDLYNDGEDLVSLDNLKHASIKLLLGSVPSPASSRG